MPLKHHAGSLKSAGTQGRMPHMDKKQQFNFSYFMIAFLAITLLQVWLGSRNVSQIAYSQFQQLLVDKQVSDVVV
jgi:cell division protease FtsH